MEVAPIVQRPLKRLRTATRKSGRFLVQNRDEIGTTIRNDLDRLLKDTEELDRELWKAVQTTKDQIFAMMDGVNTAVKKNTVQTESLKRAWNKVQRSTKALAADTRRMTVRSRKSMH